MKSMPFDKEEETSIIPHLKETFNPPEVAETLLFNGIEIPVFHIAGQKVLALNQFGKIAYPKNPNSIYKAYYRNKDELENYVILDRLSNIGQNVQYKNLKLFITFPGILKILMLIKTPERSLIMDWVVNILSMKMLSKATSQPIVSQTTSITPIDSLTIVNLENHQVRIRKEVEKLKVNDLFYSGEINYFHNKLEDVEREIKEIKSINQFQIDSQNGASKVPEPGTIRKQVETIKFLIKAVAQKEGVHFNQVCNELKRAFNIYRYSALDIKNYKEVVSLLNNRLDKTEKAKTAISKKDSTLDTWVKQAKEGLGDCK